MSKAPNVLERRYANEMVGSLVLVSLVVFLAALVQSGRLRNWFDPGRELKVLLPAEGLFGLREGAEVEILGAKAGTVHAIVIDPDQQFHANVRIRSDMAPFVRRDSKAMIRKKFGVAGDTYLEITRGQAAEMDWDFAVISAQADRAPTEAMQAFLDDLRNETFPTIREARRALTTWADLGDDLRNPEGNLARAVTSVGDLAQTIQSGKGVFGRLMTDESLATQTDEIVTKLVQRLDELEPILADLRSTSRNLEALSAGAAQKADALPQMIDDAQANLRALRGVLDEVSKASVNLPRIADNVEGATVALPNLIVQLERTLYEVERLTQQLRGSWLVGGGGAGREPEEGVRLSPGEAQP